MIIPFRNLTNQQTPKTSRNTITALRRKWLFKYNQPLALIPQALFSEAMIGLTPVPFQMFLWFLPES